MINLLIWSMFGALSGWIISLLYSNGGPGSSRRYILVGIFGALVGGIVSQAIKGDSLNGFNDMSVVFAVIGALLLAGAQKKLNT